MYLQLQCRKQPRLLAAVPGRSMSTGSADGQISLLPILPCRTEAAGIEGFISQVSSLWHPRLWWAGHTVICCIRNIFFFFFCVHEPPRAGTYNEHTATAVHSLLVPSPLFSDFRAPYPFPHSYNLTHGRDRPDFVTDSVCGGSRWS